MPLVQELTVTQFFFMRNEGLQVVGAPETFRSYTMIDPFPVSVKQSVDVWSMGCVFSEVAVWSRFGWNRLLEYRRQRQDEIKQRLDLNGEHWFHDEHNVLKTVQGIHDNIARSSRSVDQVIVNILRLVSTNMLLNEHERRASARNILTELTRVIDTTRKSLNAMRSSRDGNGAEDGSDSEERPITPPSVPPGYISESSEPSLKYARPNVGTSLFSPPAPLRMPRPNSSTLQAELAFHHHKTKVTNRNYQGQLIDKSFGPFHSDSNSLHSLPDPPNPASSYHSSDADAGSLSRTDGIRTHQGKGGQHSNREPENMVGNASLSRRHLAKGAMPTSHLFQSTPAQASSNDPLESLQRSEVPIAATASPGSNGTTSPRSADNPLSPNFQVKKHQEEPPQLSLSEGLLWREKRKQGLQNPLHGQENLASLNVRDHVGALSQMLISKPILLK